MAVSSVEMTTDLVPMFGQESRSCQLLEFIPSQDLASLRLAKASEPDAGHLKCHE